jgi:hypothetical protein
VKLGLLLLLSVQLQAGYLTAEQKSIIVSNWGDYSFAAKTVGIPVAILPAIHLRESELRAGVYSVRLDKVVRNAGGPFMLDRGGDGSIAFLDRIRAYEEKVFKLYKYPGSVAPRVRRDFRFAALVAAHELKAKMRGRGLADAVWGYNGRVGEFALSAYVWNDPRAGKRLLLKRSRFGKPFEGPDERPGVMTVYREISEFMARRALGREM